MDSKAEEIILKVDSYQSALVVVLSRLFVKLKAVALEVSNCAIDEVGRNSNVAVLSEIRRLHKLEIGCGEYGAVFRKSENRVGSNRRPQLSDLRESGSIEQDADMVIFIHRYDYQGLNEDPNDVGKTQIIIAKHRNGAIADVDMRFRADEVRFVDEEESLIHQASTMSVASAMNADNPPFDNPPFDMGPSNGASDDFGGTSDFM